MSVELRPLGVNCNIQCQYCYQNPQRDAGNLADSYDMDAMKEAIEQEGGDFTLFGGEPLLIPLDDLEELLRWGFERQGANTIQTNGTLITDAHIRLFHKYPVRVGISVDGPGELNDARWFGTLERTREGTIKTHQAIERLCREGLSPSLIVTLHRTNATPAKLPEMHDWFRSLDRMGVEAVRIHALEVDNEMVRLKYALSDAENVQALLSFAELQKDLKRLRIDLFREMEDLLLVRDGQASCVWRACDPYTTEAVRGVEGHGERSNCGRTNKDGIDFTKADIQGFERYIALYHTPQSAGGCNQCRFFLSCKGQCPGTAMGGDWRNKTEHCQIWMDLFTHIETDMVERGITPLSLHPNLGQLEERMLQEWAAGVNPPMEMVLKKMQDEYYGADRAASQ